MNTLFCRAIPNLASLIGATSAHKPIHPNTYSPLHRLYLKYGFLSPNSNSSDSMYVPRISSSLRRSLLSFSLLYATLNIKAVAAAANIIAMLTP